MRKLSFLIAVAALFAVAILAINDTPAQAEASTDADLVRICHFPGHEGDFVPTGPIDGPVRACLGENLDGETTPPLGGPNSSGDGIVMWVSVKACEKGHKIQSGCS